VYKWAPGFVFRYMYCAWCALVACYCCEHLSTTDGAVVLLAGLRPNCAGVPSLAMFIVCYAVPAVLPQPSNYKSDFEKAVCAVYCSIVEYPGECCNILRIVRVLNSTSTWVYPKGNMFEVQHRIVSLYR